MNIPIIDLFSDTKTRPSKLMLDAMVTAETGDEQAGEDPTTLCLQDRVASLLGKDSALFVPSGTMCNQIALAVQCNAGDEIIADKTSHLINFEAGGAAVFSRAMIKSLEGERGQFTLDQARAAIRTGFRHAPSSRMIAVEQTANLGGGSIWPLENLKSLQALAVENGLVMHMDGARFANALVTLDVTPAQMTWRSGIDVLSFGGTKNGCLAAEAVVFFRPELVGDFPFLQKRAGQLLSKSRFISSQLAGYLKDGTWLRNARQANAMAQRLSKGLAALPGIELAYPTQSNEVFVSMPSALIERLSAQGMPVNDEELDGKAVRFVAAWNTTESEVDALLAVLSDHCASV